MPDPIIAQTTDEVLDAREQTGVSTDGLTAAENEQRVRHTAGPWQLGWLGEHGSFEIGVGYLEGQRLSRDGFVIASRADIHHRSDEMRANARLIVAAPELLEALRAFYSHFNGDDYETGLWPLMDTARAVIAKVEGR